MSTQQQLREQWLPGDSAVFVYGFPPDPTSEISTELNPRSKSPVIIVSEEDPDNMRTTFPTQQERFEAGAPVCYRVRFADGHEATAFEDELFTHASA